jgi:hypothetical protein
MSINRRLAFKSAAERAAERRQQGLVMFLDHFSGEKIALRLETLWKLQIRSSTLGWNIIHCQVRFALTRKQ